ncbi:UNVERIFIED_CONTAM: class I heat shock protein [Sesamum angustifolium]|uniref:Class I heat shock protein n=1 Tax=Sesamum angustifolium TaxID=2727405 RepID=A0AAW2P146_9LAMI
MSLIPCFFGTRRSNVFDPLSLDIWDPFERCPFLNTVANLPSSARETTAFADAHVDWKETPEAHVFKVDVPGLKKEEVKVEVEDGRVLQISGERSWELQEEKNENGTAWRGAKGRSSAGLGCRRMRSWGR